MKYFIGFDVGKNGGIAVLDHKNNVLLKSMPKIGKEIDLIGVRDFLLSFDSEAKISCVIEDVHSIFGSGATSNFQFGRALGVLEMAVVMLNFSFTKVAPKKWQKEMWEGVQPVLINTGKTNKKDGSIKYKVDTKATSLIACKRLFPNIDLRNTNRKTDRSKKEHDGIVDALLMAEYCRRKFN